MGYTEHKQTETTTESAVDAANIISQREEVSQEQFFLWNYCRFRLRVNSGLQRKGGPVGLLALLSYFITIQGFEFVRVIAYLGNCYCTSPAPPFFPDKENVFTAKQWFFFPIIWTLSLLHREAELLRSQLLSPSLSLSLCSAGTFKMEYDLGENYISPKMWRNNVFSEILPFIFLESQLKGELTQSGSWCCVFVHGCAPLSLSLIINRLHT